jgi:hypothetical protein
MADPRDPLTEMEKAIFGHDAVRDPVTGRVFEQGEKASPREAQASQFLRDRDLAGIRPKQGERCLQTGREFECGSGSLSKERQTASFLDELPPAEKAQRKAAFEAMVA